MQPSLFSSPQPAPQSPGLPWGWILLVGVLGYFALQGRGCGHMVPAPEPPPGPNLVAAFASNDDRGQASADAHAFATICTALADTLEYDGTRPQPLLKTGVQIDELRRNVRQLRMHGGSFLPRYPQLGLELDAFLTAAVGTSGGPIDATQRAKWITALRQLAACAQYAADQG
jgi:hypothetical protein